MRYYQRIEYCQLCISHCTLTLLVCEGPQVTYTAVKAGVEVMLESSGLPGKVACDEVVEESQMDLTIFSRG